MAEEAVADPAQGAPAEESTTEEAQGAPAPAEEASEAPPPAATEGEAPAPPAEETKEPPAPEAPADQAAADPGAAASEEPSAPPAAEEVPAEAAPPTSTEQPAPAAAEEDPAAAQSAEQQEAPATEVPAPTEEPAAPTAPAPAAGEEAAPAEAAQTAPAAANLSDVAQIPDTLHVAAASGNLEAVKMLIRNGVDPTHKDSNGKTALELAEEAGHEHLFDDLRAALAAAITNTPAEPPVAAAEEPPAVTPVPASSPEPEAAPVNPAPPKDTALPPLENPPEPPLAQGYAAPKPEQQMGSTVSDFRAGKDPGATPTGSLDRAQSAEGSLNRSRKRENFTIGTSPGGVLTRTPHMVSFSKFESSPKWTMRTRGGSSLVRSTYTPAPGAYELPLVDRVKFKSAAKFGFGTGSRFGMGEALGGGAKRDMPGPGQYTPNDPQLSSGTRVGFGTSVRQGLSSRIRSPGPGTYELHTCIGRGSPMFTATGKQPTSYLKKSSGLCPSPGPGAYNSGTGLDNGPKCGFGTSSRDAEIRRMGGMSGGEAGQNPGPGAYDGQASMQLGACAPKFSITSRRRMHDLNSYMSPGPGAYNANITSFGY